MKMNRSILHARLSASILVTAITLTSTAVTVACDCAKNATQPSTATAAATSVAVSETPASPSRKFPLKGVITDILPDRSALMVKHEAIPGVMKAMTMLFIVDADVLPRVKKGDTITALMSRRDDEWRLDEVKIVPATIPST